ncbi:MAG TPA: hypothetical protein VIJ68_04160 [Candidatus Saccharimonadales bacterium]
MSGAKQQKSHVPSKLLRQAGIIEAYKARLVELDAEYADEIIRLAAIIQLENRKQ